MSKYRNKSGRQPPHMWRSGSQSFGPASSGGRRQSGGAASPTLILVIILIVVLVGFSLYLSMG